MIRFPNAKINLGLDITEKRADGYHNLESIFIPVPWQDALEIIPSETLTFASSGIPIPGDLESNLCLKVYHAISIQHRIPPVHIHLHKNIPIGAGMGGGSSDAAFTATMLRDMFQLPLSDDDLENIVRPLGADCAFFVRNTAVYAYEKGDIFKPVELLELKGKYILMLYPQIHISTKEAYSGVKPKKAEFHLLESITKPISEWKHCIKNDFEGHLFEKYTDLPWIKDTMYQSGALFASMTGSGSAVYGIFDNKPEIEQFRNRSYIIKGDFI